MKWVAIDGNFDFTPSNIKFLGEPKPFTDSQGNQQTGIGYGLAMNSERFSGGEISAQIQFSEVGEANACELIFYFDPARRWFVSAGLGGAKYMYFIRHWDGQWRLNAVGGDKKNLEANRKYTIDVRVRGSKVTLFVDDVEVISTVLPFALPPSQTGVHCLDSNTIEVSKFRVSTKRGRAFIVMQFSSPFTEIYEEVIRGVCDEFNIEAHRADETYGPGLIIADVVREIAESEFVIAEISPPNPNVYYEIGYSHAINKPTILLASRDIEKLPFDISGFRVLFYEDSIAGKRKFEEGLRRHILAILEKDAIPPGKPV